MNTSAGRHRAETMKTKLYQWRFYVGSLTADPDCMIEDIYLSYSFADLLQHDPVSRKALDEEREKEACAALYKLGMEPFDVAGDQRPWLYVEADESRCGIDRNNNVIDLRSGKTKFALDDSPAIRKFPKSL